MGIRYSPAPAELFGYFDPSTATYLGLGKEIMSHEKSFALWNLIWLSFPSIDSLLDHEHPKNAFVITETVFDLISALRKTLMQKCSGKTIKTLLRQLNPIELTEHISLSRHNHLEIYKALGPSWIATINTRAKQYRGEQSRNNGVIFANFRQKIAGKRSAAHPKCNCHMCEMICSGPHLESWIAITDKVPLAITRTVLSECIWWTTHSSGNAVRARGMTRQLEPTDSGYAIKLGRNSFRIERAIRKCASVFVDRALRTPYQTLPACSTERPIIFDLQSAITSSVGNSRGSRDYVDNYPVIDGMLNFGAHAISVGDFLDSLILAVKERSLATQVIELSAS